MFDGKRIEHTDEEWEKALSEKQYEVLRRASTEPPFTNEYFECTASGVYSCAACHLPLFSSKSKYPSDCGWPSFTNPLFRENVAYKEDFKLGIRRIEVLCPRCGSHLGHLFDDGPLPYKNRYCINSAALKLQKD